MPFRMIKDTIRTSRNVNSLTDFQFRVWVHLITYVDDFGRGSADPELLKGLLFPRRHGITEKQLDDAIGTLASKGMVTLYEEDGEPYFYFPKWGEHQRIRTKVSKFPEPPTDCGDLPQSAAGCGELLQNAARNLNLNLNQKPKPETYKPKPEPEPDACACACEEPENDLGRVMACYMDRINPTPSRTCIDSLKAYTERLGADVVLHAIEIALDDRKQSWSYISAILQRYQRDGLDSLEKIQDDDRRREADKARRQQTTGRKALTFMDV